MPFDIVLPTLISLIATTVIMLYGRFEAKLKTLFEEQAFRIRDAVFLVIAMGVMLAVIIIVPQLAIQILFLAAYSFILFLFTYVALEKWYFAILLPAVFVVLYIFFWNIILLDIFAIVFSILISLYVGGLFSWTTVLAFAGILTVYDFIQVFGTRFMGEAASKLVGLQLPAFIVWYTFPRESAGLSLLGLGDIFLACLLAVQTMKKYGRKAGVISAITVGVAFFFFEVAVFSLEYAYYFPATLVVVCGWLLGLGINRLLNWKRSS